MIKAYYSFNEIDKKQFKALVPKSFGEHFSLNKGYFEYAEPSLILIEDEEGDEYAGAAVLEHIPWTTVSYLDKLMVDKKYSGNGVGSKLWEAIKHVNKLTWRTSKHNPIKGWYEGKYDGKEDFEDQPYTYYQYGLTSQEYPSSLAYAMQKKPTI